VIVREKDHNEVKLMRWGLVPSWADDPSIGNRMINARAETLAEKPSFKDPLGSRRCLVPANGFFEWRREGKHKVRCELYGRIESLSCSLDFGIYGVTRKERSFTLLRLSPPKRTR